MLDPQKAIRTYGHCDDLAASLTAAARRRKAKLNRAILGASPGEARRGAHLQARLARPDTLAAERFFARRSLWRPAAQ